ncbi:MAG TPA: hypothetical protein VMS98_13620 [Thermoanaerobaculia bacterium]|nr:hypothetical protein [Thermoanaerobaculia bacterium]
MVRVYDRIAAALVWAAAFSFAAGVFLSLTLLLKWLPPTEPVAIGLVPIERYSKLKDYVAAALFFLTVPPLTIWFQRIGGRLLERERARFRARRMVVAVLLTGPILFAPLLYLTTGKVGWILLLPLVLSFAATRALHFYDTSLWFRRLFRPELHPYHALVFCQGMAWIIYRYIATSRRIAHYPTLFLEVVFVAFFLFLFLAVAVYAARMAQITHGADLEDTYRRVATGALPFTILPVVSLLMVPSDHRGAAMVLSILVSAALILRLRRPLQPRRAWGLAAFIIIPAFIYCLSYASTAQLSAWIDLFHRGESIGPASDYLRGKVPYRDVFALHGMLEDGLLDAWLMQLFGRSLDVAVARTVVVGAFLPVTLWFLGVAIFRSIPLAVLVVTIGSWTTAENNRTLFQVAAVALLWVALQRRSPLAAVASGAFAAVALFFSYEIGLYTIAGAAATLLILAFVRVDPPFTRRFLATLGLWFAGGALAGASPFVVFLLWRGALDDFVTVSFVTIPRIIDAVWSLPFPDITSTFRQNLSLHTLSEFVLYEKFRLILSPLTIAVAAVYLIQRAIRRPLDRLDVALLVLTVSATVAQRTAFGRVSFRHQYFAAFLIAPILVVLAVLFARRLRETWREGDEGTRAFTVAVIAACVPILIVLFWIPDLVNARIDDLLRYQARILRVHHDGRADEVNFRIAAVSAAIGEMTKKGEPIFDFSNQPAFYFFADRPNPTRFYQVPIASPPAFQAEIIRALERTKPKVVIRTSPEDFDEFDGVPNAMRAQAVAAYIDQTYSYALTARGVELWRRKPSTPPADVAGLLRRIRLPDKEDLVAAGDRTRLVFPGIGSTPGANDSFWRSDLILHNPFKEKLDLRLRYVAGDTRIHRSVVLAGGRTIRWEDVVKTLFAAPDSVGVLWIDYRGQRGPVARVRTYDVTRSGSGSMESPLSARDSANAYGERPDLVIVGLPGGGPAARRINAGVVNIGEFPATFRITVHNTQGRQVGGWHEQGLPEYELALVSDLDKLLGVSIDESMTVRVRMIAGTGIAYATVVDSARGDNRFIAAVPSPKP